MQRSTQSRTILPGLKRKDSIRRPTRRFYFSDLAVPFKSVMLGKSIAVVFILFVNVYLFQMHDQSLDSGVKRFLREKVTQVLPLSLLDSTTPIEQVDVTAELSAKDLFDSLDAAEKQNNEQHLETILQDEVHD